MESVDRFRQYVANLQLLHKVLASGPLADRYGVFGGLLLGIVREGRPLPGDWDADFYYLDYDEERFDRCIPALVDAGFKRLFKFVANDGIAWEYSFLKDEAKFEFFRTTAGESGELYYNDFVVGASPRQQKKSFIGLPLVPMEFLGCRWMVVKDVEAGLKSAYGDWRTPDANWNWANDPLTIAREPWSKSSSIHWQ